MTVVLEDIHPVAHKAHRCDVCGGTIAGGDRYHRQRNIWEGEPNVFKAHELCSAAWWKAHQDLQLWDDESPDWEEDIKPIIESLLQLVPGSSTSKNREV